MNMGVIAAQHLRIAHAIEKFWGHRECEELMQNLILNGHTEDGANRQGFRPEVMAAFMNLVAIHLREFGVLVPQKRNGPWSDPV